MSTPRAVMVDTPPATPHMRKKSVVGSSGSSGNMGRTKSFSRQKSFARSRDGNSGGETPGANTGDIQDQLNIAIVNRLKSQYDQLVHRLDSEGKKVVENSTRIDHLEAMLREMEQTNAQEAIEHEVVVAVGMEKLEDLQDQLAEALREHDELLGAVTEVVDGDELKKRSNALRMEQLVNFVLAGSSNDCTISAEEIDRDVTGERVRALALYEEEAHEGRKLRVTYQRRRELWENYELLWLRESDPSFKPKCSNSTGAVHATASYYMMLDPHRCRWSTCVLDRCASEYMTTKLATLNAEEAPGVSVGGAMMAAKAARKFAAHRRSSAATPKAVVAVAAGGQDQEELLFPHALRR